MNWQNSLDWLLDVDPDNPGVRYFALADLLNYPTDDPDLLAARQAVMAQGPVPAILANQEADGYWVEPGPGYYPKYRGSVWQIIFLAQLAADGRDPRVRTGCDYLLDHSPSRHGVFSMNGTPSGQIHCLEGNLAAAMIDLGLLGDARLDAALLLSKIDAQGRWKMEYTYNGKTWVDVEEKGQPSKWVTLRASRVLKGTGT